MSDWQYLTPMNIGAPGSNVRANGGGGINAITFRDGLDSARTPMGQRVPSAQYPDGYLGTIQSRREDRLLNSLKVRMNQRSYQRGVHKGERIDPADYFWPPEFGPQKGVEYEARGLKWTASGNPVERLVNGGKAAVSGPEVQAIAKQYGVEQSPVPTLDPIRQEQLARLLPSWR